MFAILYRRDERMSFAMLLSEYDILVNSCLYLFIEIAVCKVQHQSVGPFFVYHTDFPDNRFVVKLVVEAFYVIYFTAVGTFCYAIFAEFRNVIVYVVIVVREVLKGIDFIGKAVLEGLAEMYV